MILAEADIAAWVNSGAALTNDDVAGDDLLAAELLDAEALGFRIARNATPASDTPLTLPTTPYVSFLPGSTRVPR